MAESEPYPGGGEPTRGGSSSDVPGGWRVSADSFLQDPARAERFLRYLDHLLVDRDLDAGGRVAEIFLRALLENYRTISVGEYRLIYDALRFGAEILRRKPDLLVELLVESGEYSWQEIHDLVGRDLARGEPMPERALVPRFRPPAADPDAT